MGQKLNHLDDAFVEEQVFGLLDFTNWKCISGWETLQWNLHGGNALQKWSNSAEKHWKSSFELVYITLPCAQLTRLGQLIPVQSGVWNTQTGWMDWLENLQQSEKAEYLESAIKLSFFCNCKFLCQLIDGEKLDIEGDAVRDSSGVSHLQRELVPGLKREQLGGWNV